jgi:hypothetical protein
LKHIHVQVIEERGLTDARVVSPSGHVQNFDNKKQGFFASHTLPPEAAIPG